MITDTLWPSSFSLSCFTHRPAVFPGVIDPSSWDDTICLIFSSFSSGATGHEGSIRAHPEALGAFVGWSCESEALRPFFSLTCLSRYSHSHQPTQFYSLVFPKSPKASLTVPELLGSCKDEVTRRSRCRRSCVSTNTSRHGQSALT